jgi:hypothetical protein
VPFFASGVGCLKLRGDIVVIDEAGLLCVSAVRGKNDRGAQVGLRRCVARAVEV